MDDSTRAAPTVTIQGVEQVGVCVHLRHVATNELGIVHAPPPVEVGDILASRNLAVTANTYTHVLLDEAELDYAELLARRP